MNLIKIDINKYRAFAHDKRREARAAEFAPLDIKATIPSEAVKAETERQKIRNKYDELQRKIDAAQTVEELKKLLPK